MLYFLLVGAIVYVLLGLRVINEYERAIKFTFGKFSGVINSGLKLFLPVIHTYRKVDLRTITVDVPDQEAITKDNISLKINAVVYYKVEDPKKAILDVENYYYATSELAQLTMRNIIGEFSLDDVLSAREKISKKIKDIVDKETDPWGIKVRSVDLKDITLPVEMKRVLAREAEAEREKRAVVLKAKGEVEASQNLAKAAKLLADTPGALHIRTLHSINDISNDQSNTVLFTLPMELMNAYIDKKKK